MVIRIFNRLRLPARASQPAGRAGGLLVCKIPLLARALGLKAEAARPSARATIEFLVYKRFALTSALFCIQNTLSSRACLAECAREQRYLMHTIFCAYAKCIWLDEARGQMFYITMINTNPMCTCLIICIPLASHVTNKR